MIDIRRPNITAQSAEGQLSQIKTYLYQLTGQLNFALKTVEDEEKKAAVYSAGRSTSSSNAEEDADSTQKSFDEIKALIIKSADIIDAYYEEINRKLSSEYVALSAFGEYTEKNDKLVSETSENLTEYYESVKKIESDIQNISEMRKDSFYIRTGWLDDDNTIGGIELGQISEDGAGADVAFARFTTKKMVFYATDGKTELGSFEQYRLKIKDAEISGDLRLGNYILETENGIAFKWAGGN